MRTLISLVIGATLAFAGGGALISLAAPTPPIPITGAPVVLPYDGYLTQGEMPYNGPVSIVFTLHSGETCTGCDLWTETQTVQVHGGLYTVGLGAVTPITTQLNSNNRLWLSMRVGGSQLAGRQAIVPAPFAYYSARTDAVAVGEIAPASGNIVAFGHPAVVVNGDLYLGKANGVTKKALSTQLTNGGADVQLVVNTDGHYTGGVHSTGDSDYHLGVSANGFTANRLQSDTVTATGLTYAGATTVVTAPTSGAVAASYYPSQASCGNRTMTAIKAGTSDSSGTRRVSLEAECR